MHQLHLRTSTAQVHKEKIVASTVTCLSLRSLTAFLLCLQPSESSVFSCHASMSSSPAWRTSASRRLCKYMTGLVILRNTRGALKTADGGNSRTRLMEAAKHDEAHAAVPCRLADNEHLGNVIVKRCLPLLLEDQPPRRFDCYEKIFAAEMCDQ